jgi:formylglycine-generating enzyme required for sulfatase activity
VTIPAGTFLMGSPASEGCRLENEDWHQVTLTHAFEIMSTEATQGEFKRAMGYNPAFFTSCGKSCPVERVSWHEAVAYCNALSRQKGLAACYTCAGSGPSVTCQEAFAYSGTLIYGCPGYRLPTDAEWEYAYRAGTTTAYYNGPNDSANCLSCTDVNASVVGWYYCNSGSTTHPVGQKLANAWGLYDMAGNVSEWSHDRHQDHLGSSASTDPVGSGKDIRVIRGGEWSFYAKSMRAARRTHGAPTHQFKQIGFRCCRTK